MTLQGMLAWDKHSRAMGLLASDRAPEGFLSSRIDFIGRGRRLRSPRVLETLAFSAAMDILAHPTLRPDRQFARQHDRSRARVVPSSPLDRSDDR